MLELHQICKTYQTSGRNVEAVRNVSFNINENEIFALIGESGCGKSTLAEMIAGLIKPSSGKIEWTGRASIEDGSRPVQLVFQNPERSMNPLWRIGDIVQEPLKLAGYSHDKARRKAAEWLERVHLSAGLMDRFPHEISGGQKQRAAIARALCMRPQLLIADELTSALDPLTERRLLELLLQARADSTMAVLYITHRIETIRGFADRTAVMKEGEIVEQGATNRVLDDPSSSYTEKLISACTF